MNGHKMQLRGHLRVCVPNETFHQDDKMTIDCNNVPKHTGGIQGLGLFCGGYNILLQVLDFFSFSSVCLESEEGRKTRS